MYTKSHTYREEKRNTRKQQQQQQDTNSTQGTHNTIITGATLIGEKHSPTPAHQLKPKKRKKKQTHYVKPKRNSFTSPLPRRLQSHNKQHTPQEQKYVRGNTV
ncbi:uncharacterized protein TM35_000281850 [Trypanosoma theileri]|uniref:Uncharacterized protein n=1 Tax=Trypanosoma theileri TaxID=67003 RepID=A0A1X0NQL0_9TRYP|nr:uncharacterized protein TM35_000281850 [Trypanosoma theileri]ORC86469.1 hypothetical protein TM35_000281850 [Trypanosoma theileri]